MELSLSPASQGLVPASPSESLKRLRQQLLERGLDKDYFETQVEGRFHCLTFTNALILSALASDGEAFALRERLCRRLEQELAPVGTANYRMRSVPGAQPSPYPNDLDDTFCALSAIFLHDKQRLDGDQLAKATMALTATEVEPGGPYRTWLVQPDAAPIWRDIDPAVNANVAYFLKLNGIRLPKLDAYLASQISLPASPYYPSPLHVLYFLTRALEGTPHTRQLEATLLECQPDNILERALLITSLLRCNAIKPARALMPGLIQALDVGQGLAALPICVDTISGGEKFFAVCSEVTAALCIEALRLLETTVETPTPSINQLEPTHSVIATAKMLLSTTEDPVLQTLTDGFLAKLTNIPQVRELTTLPLDFAQAWNNQTQQLSAEVLQNLSVGHLLGWVAYTLYDDIIDDDGTPALSSIANIAARQMYRLFRDLNLDDDFQRFFHARLDGMDEANATELLHARFPLERLPDYSDNKSLYGRSGGVMLSSVAVLRLAGYPQTAPEIAGVTTFFEHYLAAKQLNDDAHDWQKDLTNGHATSVVTKILASYGQAYNPSDLQKLQKIFWHEVIVDVCRDINDHIVKAREAVRSFGAIEKPSFFTKLIEPLAASAEKALVERERSLAFLATFTDQQP
ncbi:MAG: hypothetical protein AAB776_00385 [Patescibacteria group bacterium]